MCFLPSTITHAPILDSVRDTNSSCEFECWLHQTYSVGGEAAAVPSIVSGVPPLMVVRLSVLLFVDAFLPLLFFPGRFVCCCAGAVCFPCSGSPIKATKKGGRGCLWRQASICVSLLLSVLPIVVSVSCRWENSCSDPENQAYFPALFWLTGDFLRHHPTTTNNNKTNKNDGHHPFSLSTARPPVGDRKTDNSLGASQKPTLPRQFR